MALRKFFIATVLVALAVGRGAAAALPPAVGGQELPTLAPMLERVTPAVVNISTTSTVRIRENPLLQDPFFRRFFDLPEPRPRSRRTQSLGSGVIVDAGAGLVVTNAHVIDKADEITVTLQDGRSLTAELIGADPESDVAVVKIPSQQLTAIALGDSDALRVGDFVVAIGNPFGLNQTVTSGIVSALGRRGLGIEGYEDFIQTDASINPGNSGGALVNLRGELVGINTAILAPSGGNVGIGFAIPINMVRELTGQLTKYGAVQRGRLGVYVQDLTPELAQAFGLEQRQGAVISQIVPDSPAEKAGLQEGDVVIRVDGRSVEDGGDLRNAVGLLRVGETVELTIVRKGRERVVRATVDKAQLATVEGETLNPRLAGATFSERPEDQLRGQAGAGVLVQDVAGASPAWNAGLRKDDIVVSANRRRVDSLDDLRAATQGSNGILLNIRRGDGALFLAIR